MNCPLCGYQLTSRAHQYAEGLFCDDVAGCRRRALARVRDLESTLVDMHGRLCGIREVLRAGR